MGKGLAIIDIGNGEIRDMEKRILGERMQAILHKEPRIEQINLSRESERVATYERAEQGSYSFIIASGATIQEIQERNLFKGKLIAYVPKTNKDATFKEIDLEYKTLYRSDVEKFKELETRVLRKLEEYL